MFTADPHNIRPKRDWAIILQDPRKSVLSSGILLPMETNDEKLHEGSGIVIRLGVGPKVTGTSLREGDRVLYRTYLRHAVTIDSDKKWSDGSRMEFFFMDVTDIAAVISTDLEVGALSERKLS
jgi:co-chaperonin GroES (HSP10)